MSNEKNEDKKLLYEFLNSYPKKNDTHSQSNNNNQENSIETLINFMKFMNSKDKKINSSDGDKKNSDFEKDFKNKIMSNEETNNLNNEKENEINNDKDNDNYINDDGNDINEKKETNGNNGDFNEENGQANDREDSHINEEENMQMEIIK